MKKYFFLFVLFLLCLGPLFAQQTGIDSLRKPAVNHNLNDTTKVNNFLKYSLKYRALSPESSLLYARKGLSLAKSIHFNKGIIKSYLSLTQTFINKTEYLDSAIFYGLLAKNKSIEAGDYSLMGTIFEYISYTYQLQNNYKSALLYIDSAAQQFLKTDTLNYIVSLTRKGELMMTVNDTSGAKETFRNALRFTGYVSEQSQFFSFFVMLGEYYLWIGKNEPARKYLQTGEKIAISTKNKKYLAYVLGQIAITYKGEKNYRTAIEYAEKGLKVATQNKLEKETRDNQMNLYQIYKESKDYKKALDYFEQIVKYQDSVKASSFDKDISRLNMQVENIKNKEQMDLMKHQNVLQKAELAKQKLQKTVYIIGGSLLVMIVLGLLSRLRYSRKTKQKLEQKNIQIEKEKQRAEQSEKFEQQFLANMSHEIRTPMNAVMGMTNLVLDTPLNEKQRFYLKGVQKSSETLIHIINDILDISKIEAGKIELEQIDFSIREVVDQVKQILYHKAEEKGLHLIVDIDDNVNDIVVGDPVRLNQILINLAGNAIKFTDKGSVTIKYKSENSNLKFEIIDTGIGIPKDKLEKVFESFSQAHISDTRKFGGTGLGLTISKQLVELMGGNISIESEEGSGSTFSFTVNYALGSIERLTEQKSSEQINGSILNGLKILVVDDNEYNRIVTHDTLKSKSNVEITEAVNGKEAIDLLAQNDFDVVLMDVQMPVMDGYDATRYIREKFDSPKNKIPVIALTASVIRSDLDKCRQAGMNDYVPKPFKASQLFTAIANAAGRKIEFAKKEKETKPTGESAPEEQNNKQVSSVTDLAYLDNFCEGDKIRMQKYINMFLDSAPSLIEKINDSLAKNDYEDVANQIHGFKTKWIMMGMKTSKDLALKIETRCRENLTDKSTTEDISALIVYINSAIKELSSS